MTTVVNAEKCTGCGLCVEVCPSDAILLIEKKAIITVDCVECGACAKECPVEAIYYAIL